LDPPYKPESDRADSNFNKYSPGGFDEGDQERVRDLASELDKRGAYVMITNSPEAKDIYKNDRMENFRIVGVRAMRAINSDSSQRKNLGVTDIIITNSPQFWEHGDFDDFR
jgi:DNA adenine methylase